MGNSISYTESSLFHTCRINGELAYDVRREGDWTENTTAVYFIGSNGKDFAGLVVKKLKNKV